MQIATCEGFAGSSNSFSTVRRHESLNSVLPGTDVCNAQEGPAEPLAEEALASRAAALV